MMNKLSTIKNEFSLTIVVTFFKNVNIVNSILKNIIDFKGNSKYKIEVILINDSADSSNFQIQDIQSLNIKFFNFKKNVGVTSARNFGYKNALSNLILFLDSDDLLITNTMDLMMNFIRINKADVYFFRCIDENGSLVGDIQKEIYYSKTPNLQYGKGERIICVKRNINKPFIGFLRGSENTGLLYYAFMSKDLLFCWADFPIRVYKNNIQGLSSKINSTNRSFLISIGHLLSVFFSIYFFEFKWAIRFLISFFYRLYRTILSILSPTTLHENINNKST